MLFLVLKESSEMESHHEVAHIGGPSPKHWGPKCNVDENQEHC
jgi:hypothetical protein